MLPAEEFTSSINGNDILKLGISAGLKAVRILT